MPALTKNKKIIIGALAVFLVLGFVFVLNAPEAQAGVGDYILNGLAWVAYSILLFFSKLITLAAYLLKSAFEIENITSFTKVPIVTTGWGITRGLCNMFFALILLLMAFDTILQTNKFPIKTILPKLILVALTINFSLIFLGIIIDFSQILTRYFITAAGGTSGDIGVQLANGLNMAKVFQTPTNLTSDAQLQQAFGGTSSSFLSIISSLIFGIIIILIAAFAIGAGAIFMLVRLVSLWVLLITAPLAWLAMVAPLPGLSSLTGDWWKKFFQWTFFAPIYAFFIYLSVLASSAAATFSRTNTGSLNDKKVVGEIFTNGFLAGDGIATMMQYLVIIMLLLTGLKTAQSGGITGAGAVMAWGKKTGDKLKGGARRWSGAQWAYDAAANKATKWAGGAVSAIGFERFGRRLKAKGVAMETRPEEREQHKAYANNLKTMSDLDLQEEVKHAFGIRELLAARQAKERGLLERAEGEEGKAVVKKAMSTFGAYGLKDDKGKTKEQKDLEDVRFDALDTEEERKAAVRRAKENGNLDKLKPAILKDEQAMNAIMEELSPPEFTEAFKKWGKKTKQAAEATMVKTFKDNDWKSDSEAKKRELFASVTDKITAAFGNANGKVDLNNPDQMKMLAKYVSKMTAAKVAEIRSPDTKKEDLALIGQYASPDLVSTVGRERSANSEQKDFFREGVANNTDNEAKERLKGPGWIVVQEEGKKVRSKGINEARARNRSNPTA